MSGDLGTVVWEKSKGKNTQGLQKPLEDNCVIVYIAARIRLYA